MDINDICKTFVNKHLLLLLHIIRPLPSGSNWKGDHKCASGGGVSRVWSKTIILPFFGTLP